MKRTIKFLLALSSIPLSCIHLTKPTVLNANQENEQSVGKVTNHEKPTSSSHNVNSIDNLSTRTIVIKDLMRGTCSAIDNIMQRYSSKIDTLQRCILVLLISKYLGDIKQHNNQDYRFNSASLSTLYFDQLSNHASYHNKFFDYITKVSSQNYYLGSQINNLLAFAVFSKSHTMVPEFIIPIKNLGIQLDINAKDLFGMSMLNYAIASGDKKMVEVLIQYAPLVHIYGKEQALDLPALLDCAICTGKKEIIQVLMDAGADPNFLYDSKRMLRHGNALMLAEVYDQKDVAEYLMEHNCIKNLDQQDMYGQTTLMRIASTRYPKWSRIFSKLVEKANITITDLDGQNLLTHLLNRYTDIYRKYYGPFDEFIGGYKYGTDADNNQSNAEVAKQIFEDVCRDKQEMLKCLLSHKHLPRIIDHKENKKNTILIYFKELLSVIREVDQQKKIIQMLFDAGFMT